MSSPVPVVGFLILLVLLPVPEILSWLAAGVLLLIILQAMFN
jgi:hypothetical protein